MTKKRAFGYARVSSPQQADSGLGIETQISFIKSFFEPRFAAEYELLKIYLEEGESAWTIDFPKRTQGQQLYMMAGKGDLIIMNNLDRIFRNMRDMANTMHHFNEIGVRIVSPEFGNLGLYDSTDAGAWMLMNMMTMTAEMAARNYSSRMKNFKAMCKATGRSDGHPPIGYCIGRDAEGNGWYQPDPVEREMMQRMANWFRKERYQYNEIADHLNKHNFRTRIGRTKNGDQRWTESMVRDWIDAYDRVREAETAAKSKLKPGLFVMPSGMIYKIRDDLVIQSKLEKRGQSKMHRAPILESQGVQIDAKSLDSMDS